MSQFAISIDEDVRQNMTLPPPPMYDIRMGVLVPYGNNQDQRYQNVAVMKNTNVVYVDEELDVYAHPGSHRHYRMMIRHMPWKADLQLILEAARHMLLVDQYDMQYKHREGLASDMETGFWDVTYTIPRIQMMIDSDTLAWSEVSISYTLRKRIWIELFTALGHKVRWGGAVLNVRKRKV